MAEQNYKDIKYKENVYDEYSFGGSKLIGKIKAINGKNNILYKKNSKKFKILY